MDEVEHPARWAVAGGLVVALVLSVVLLIANRPPGDTETATSTDAAPDPPRAEAPEPDETRQAPALLPPNLRSLSATDLSIETVGDERRLRFTASLANLGPGPLVLLPRGNTDCAPGRHPAAQVLHRDGNGDGDFQRRQDPRDHRRDVGCMLRHPGHGHWHFDAMAGYSLRAPGSDRLLVSRDKVSFCLRDNRRVPRQRVVVRREHFGECARHSPQGISPGWVDVYTADLDSQWLRLPPRADGRVVCLDLRADPHDLLTETDETDNAASIAIRVEGSAVRRVGSARCR